MVQLTDLFLEKCFKVQQGSHRAFDFFPLDSCPAPVLKKHLAGKQNNLNLLLQPQTLPMSGVGEHVTSIGTKAAISQARHNYGHV